MCSNELSLQLAMTFGTSLQTKSSTTFGIAYDGSAVLPFYHYLLLYSTLALILGAVSSMHCYLDIIEQHPFVDHNFAVSPAGLQNVPYFFHAILCQHHY